MKINNKGQLAGWEALIILVLLITNAFTLYWLITKENQMIVNKKGSNPVIHGNRADYPLSIHIGEGGCARLDSLKGEKNAVPIAKSKP